MDKETRKYILCTFCINVMCLVVVGMGMVLMFD